MGESLDKGLPRAIGTEVDDIDPALPIIRNIPYFPSFREGKLMQDLYHQHYNRAQ